MFDRAFRHPLRRSLVVLTASLAWALAGCDATSTATAEDATGTADATSGADSVNSDGTAKTDGTATDTSPADTAGDIAADAGSDAGSDAAGDAGADTAAATATILGTWSSNFGGYEVITASAWNEMAIAKLDQTARVAITQNPANDPYNPSKFNKLAFTTPKDGSFWYCYVDYGLASAALAEASTKTADDSAPEKSGCGGFSWTQLKHAEPIAIAGTWQSNFGGTETISSRNWAAMAMAKFDNGKRFAITQNPADDKYSPSKFSRIVWTALKDGGFWYCYVDFGLDSAALAEATTKTADDAAPDKGGCGGFSWTHLAP